MGILGNIRNWAGEHRARREEEAAATRTRSTREAELIKRHNVRRDPTTSGRYILPQGDRYIDVNLNSEESVEKASETLARFETHPRIGKLSAKEQKARQQPSGALGALGSLANIGQNVSTNFDPFGGAGGSSGLGNFGDFGGIGDYDPFGGSPPTSKFQSTLPRGE